MLEEVPETILYFVHYHYGTVYCESNACVWNFPLCGVYVLEGIEGDLTPQSHSIPSNTPASKVPNTPSPDFFRQQWGRSYICPQQLSNLNHKALELDRRCLRQLGPPILAPVELCRLDSAAVLQLPSVGLWYLWWACTPYQCPIHTLEERMLLDFCGATLANRCWGSFTSRPLIKSLAEKLTTGYSGKRNCWPMTLNSVARLLDPLKGVFPNSSSYKNIPKVHQSTALPWPSPFIISGARYSCVPTNDIDRASLGSAMSSGQGLIWVATSGFGFRSFLDLEEKRRGPKQ
ncbi:LOW QUALITY PROTEIN: hypothetical protein U9M48_022133, partial [Paspalum notatum var. saurae]